ncbi:MAG: hypothetical protein OXK21_07095 [Chloroflexota bacterium]|nr:hypothetical protein [Chloroflexota bacterium]
MLRLIREHSFATVTVGIVLPGVFAAIGEYVWTDGVSGRAPVFFALVGGVSTVVVVWLLGTNGRPQQLTNSVQSEQWKAIFKTIGRIYSPRTPAELVRAIQGMTEIAAERVMEPHLGQWLRVSVVVSDVSSRSGNISVYASGNDSQPNLHLYFVARDWSSRLIVLNPGDTIRAEGKIARVTDSSLRLEECELVD